MIVPHVFPSRVFQFFSLLSYRAVDEEGSEDNNSQQDWAGGLDDLEVTVLVGEEDHHGEAADDDALEDEEDAPQDDVQGHDARRPIFALITTLGAGKTLERLIEIIQGHVGSL